MRSDIKFCPVPKKTEYGEGTFLLDSAGVISADSGGLLNSLIIAKGYKLGGMKIQVKNAPADITLTRKPLGKEEYILDISKQGVFIGYGDISGAFYGMMTLNQIIEQAGYALPFLHIEDKPDFGFRGFMLDVARCKIPKKETIYKIIDMLAAFKYNQFQLYMEGVPFEYPSFPNMTKNRELLTGEELFLIDKYCKERMIELVPCQNHFGHMRPWVQTDYNCLAECPNGFDDGPWGFKEPEILDPTDERSLELVTQMADDLLPYFSSDVYNINCDETNELGKGKSRGLCEKIGTGRVYLNYILKLYEMTKSRGKRILMWGDIIKKYPELLPELPQDVTVLEWGYDDFEPTEQSCKLMQESGVNYIVCPGTNTWNSVTGRTTTMINNIKTAAVNGLKYGALGILCTDWGDNGHHQPLCVSYPGIVWAAANSWNCAGSHSEDIAVILDRLVFSDRSGEMGQIVLDAGDYRQTEYKQPVNITFTMHLMLSDFGDSKIIENASAEDFIRIREYFADIKQRLLQADPACEDGALIKEELETAADMVSWMQLIGLYYVCTRDGDSAAAKKHLEDFVAQRESVYNRFKICWLKRNKCGYLDKSLEKLDKPYTAAMNAKE